MTDPSYPFTPLEELLKEEPDTLEVRTVNRMDGGYTAHVATIKTPNDIEVADASARDEFTALIRLKYVLDAQHQARVKLVEDRIEEIQRKTRRDKLNEILRAKREAESNPPISKCFFCGRERTGNPQGWEENPRCNRCLHERAALSAEARGPVVISETCIRGYRTITPLYWCPTCYPRPEAGSVLSSRACGCGNQKRMYRPNDTIT